MKKNLQLLKDAIRPKIASPKPLDIGIKAILKKNRP